MLVDFCAQAERCGNSFVTFLRLKDLALLEDRVMAIQSLCKVDTWLNANEEAKTDISLGPCM